MQQRLTSWVPPRVIAAAIAVALTATACGGLSSAETVETADPPPVTPAAEVATTAPVETPDAADQGAVDTEESVSAGTSEPDDVASNDAASNDVASTEEASNAGGDSTDKAETATAPTEPAAATTVPPAAATTEPIAVQLPGVDVVSLATGETANLNTFAKPGPTLVWFWAPH